MESYKNGDQVIKFIEDYKIQLAKDMDQINLSIAENQTRLATYNYNVD